MCFWKNLLSYSLDQSKMSKCKQSSRTAIKFQCFHEQENVLNGRLVQSLNEPGIFFKKKKKKNYLYYSWIRAYPWKTDPYLSSKTKYLPVVVYTQEKKPVVFLPPPSHNCYLLKPRKPVSLFSLTVVSEICRYICLESFLKVSFPPF